jgi:DNA-binding MarR family transcriptional regulator
MSKKDYELASELSAVVTRLVKKLRKESATGQQLSLTERTTLGLLNIGGMLPSELAAAEKITNQSMSQILGHLLQLGLINRTASETDKRKVIISLTEAGHEMIKQVKNEKNEWLSAALGATCTDEEQEILRRALGPLGRIINYE